MNFPDCAFWDFSLALYARPGVAPACLRLQAKHGADVNLLLYCLWLGHDQARRLTAAELGMLREHVRTLHDEVIRPLRQARTALKDLLGATPLDALIGGLRAAVKRHELDAEHIEQILLSAFGARALGPAKSESRPTEAALANADAYLANLGAGTLDGQDRADLAALVAFLGKK